MFVYRDNVEREYEKEQRNVAKEYRKTLMNPTREVAKIELRGGAQKKMLAGVDLGAAW